MKPTIYFFLLIASFLGSCAYSFTGASIPPTMKTVSVAIFENNAPLVVPNLSNSFTEALKERIRNQTSLSFQRTEGDASFEGRITGYDIRPVSITGGGGVGGSGQTNELPRAGQTRLTVTIQVKYTDSKEPKNSFEQSFSRYQDFSTVGSTLAQQEQQLIVNINRQLTEDIFNRAFANW